MASKAAEAPKSAANDRSEINGIEHVSPISRELVIALVGYAGAGTTTAADRIALLLEAEGYIIKRIKFSDLINSFDGRGLEAISEGLQQGRSKFDRATSFQDRGDAVRKGRGSFALSAMAVRSIQDMRDGAAPGSEKLAFILDSLKHPQEVELLRSVYEKSFRLVAVHCDREERIRRLWGNNISTAKYAGVSRSEIDSFIQRDAKDDEADYGQSVRDVFHLADFFLDNSLNAADGAGMNEDIDRFLKLLLGKGLVRPTAGEKAIYVAYASALQAACLSRQVGAALISEDGRLVATGKNDPPKFGGGTYDEDSEVDNRCFAWEFNDGDLSFTGCHNDRKKQELYVRIADWLSKKLSGPIAKHIFPANDLMGRDSNMDRREELARNLVGALAAQSDALKGMPGVKDAIEYSRSIHAEMAALMAAARGGISTRLSTLYVTVFPCHNCARHLVAAGVKAVYYIEPYVKSLAFELHYDSISAEHVHSDSISAKGESGKESDRMVIAPFTGVGPRMYDDFFEKRGELKDASGRFSPKLEGEPFRAVRLRELATVEEAALSLLSEP